MRENSCEPPLSVVERVPGIILALREHRRRMAHVLAGLDDVPDAMSDASVVGELAGRLRADDDRLEVLVSHLEEHLPHGEVPVLAIRRPPLASAPPAPPQRRTALCMLPSST